MIQGMSAASRIWKMEGTDSPLPPPEGSIPDDILILAPLDTFQMHDLWTVRESTGVVLSHKVGSNLLEQP